MSFKQLTPPKKMPVSLAEACVYLKVEVGAEDQLITHLIETATLSIEAFTGRALLRQQWEMVINAGFGLSWSDKSFLKFNTLKSTGGIRLPKAPFHALSADPALVSRQGSQRPVTLFRIDTSQEQTRLHIDIGVLKDGEVLLKVTYWAGYGENPEDIPAPLRSSILDLVVLMYENRGGNRFPLVPVMSPKLLAMVGPYRMSAPLI